MNSIVALYGRDVLPQVRSGIADAESRVTRSAYDVCAVPRKSG